MRRILVLLLSPTMALALACGSSETDAREGTDQAGSAIETTATADKIAITTVSKEAREFYLEARALAERLHPTEAHEVASRAVELDPWFAAAHLLLANTAPTNEEFFPALEQAVAHMDRASEGEQLMIRAAEAGAKGNADEQLALLEELVAKHPEDERAHNLLGTNLFFARQDYDAAIAEYRKAVEINPAFSPAWNLIGYAARAAGRLEEAETAFRRYIEVLPDEPNPYDSYAEFLMRVGRFEESIPQYRKALEVDSEFTFSYAGIASNQMFLGRPGEARKSLEEMYAKAPNDGIRRQALLWRAASYLHEGTRAAAVEVLEERRAISERAGDWLAVANDDVLIGRTLLDLGDPSAAERLYDEAVRVIGQAQVLDEVKEGLRRNHLYNEALVALTRKDLPTARQKAALYHERVAVSKVPFEVRQDHELMGRIALAEGNAVDAIAHFSQANQQDPRVLLLMAEAERMAGNWTAAREMARQAAEFNQLNFPFSYVRAEARKLAGAPEASNAETGSG